MPFAALIPLIASLAPMVGSLFKKGGQAGGGAVEAAADPAAAAGGIKSLFSLGNMANLGATAAQGALDQRAKSQAEASATGAQLRAQGAQPLAGQMPPGPVAQGVAGGGDNLQHILAAFRQIMSNTQQPQG